MSVFFISRLCLVLHLAGLVLMVGHTVVDFVLFLSFSKQFAVERERSLTLLQTMAKLSRLVIAGAVLLIVSGTGLFLVTGAVFGEQLWFQIKMGLIVVLVLNGSLFGGRLQTRLKNLLGENGPGANKEIGAVKARLGIFYTVQTAVFLAIIVLAVFRFS